MKYLVVSDNHGDRECLVTIYHQFKDQVDYFIHCGDSELPGDDELWQVFQVVQGNCDYDERYQKEQVIETPSDRIFVTHGHRYQVNYSLTTLGMKAQEVAASIVLFGHTHRLGCEMMCSRLFLNPGSISQPRGLPIKSFAVISSTPETFDIQYYDRTCQPVEDLQFSFKKD